jgi:O-antigen/teichoic acid export membrane protein
MPESAPRASADRATMHSFLNNKIVQMGAIRGGAVLAATGLQIWLVAQFGAAAYGEYVFFVTFCSLVMIVSKGGLDTMALKEVAIARNRGDARGIHSIRAWYLRGAVILTSATCLVLWLVYGFVSSWHAGVPSLNWGLICAASVGAVLFQILVALCRGGDQPAMADAFDAIVRTALMAIVAMGLVALRHIDATAIVLAYTLSFYLASLLLYKLTSVVAPVVAASTSEFGRQGYGARAHFGFMFAGLLSFVFFQMDTLILGAYIEPVGLGAYNMACNLVRAVIFIPMILVVLVQPRIAVAFEKADMAQVTRIALAAIGASLVAAFSCSTLLWLFGELILRWIDPVFVTAAPAMMVLAVAHVVNSVLMLVSGIVSMTSRYMDVVWAQLVGSVVALVLYALLIPSHGPIGAALSMFAGLLVVLGCYAFIYRRHIPKLYGFLLSKTQ